jgi:ribosome-associated translation inhibitor RaiA
MQIQLNTTGVDTANKESMDRWATDHLRDVLGRFRQDITRIEVHLSEANGATHCTMEARLASQAPLAVKHDGSNQDEAFRGAADKLKRTVESAVERARDKSHRERDSIRKDGALSEPVDPV